MKGNGGGGEKQKGEGLLSEEVEQQTVISYRLHPCHMPCILYIMLNYYSITMF